MQVEDVNLIKALDETLTHPSEGGIIQVPMISDKSKNTVSGSFDAPLCKSNELDIVIIQIFGVALSKRFAIYFKIVTNVLASLTIFPMQEISNPFPFVHRMPGIRWIAYNHHHRCIILDISCSSGFFHQPFSKGQSPYFELFF